MLMEAILGAALSEAGMQAPRPLPSRRLNTYARQYLAPLEDSCWQVSIKVILQDCPDYFKFCYTSLACYGTGFYYLNSLDW